MNEHLIDLLVQYLIDEGKLTIGGAKISDLHRMYLINLIKHFLYSLENLDYIIIPKNMKVDYNRVRDFEDLLWRLNAKSEQLESSDFDGAKVLSYLSSMGWIVIPPK